MPNWCSNTLALSHEDPKMIERVVKAYNEQRLCDEFIPVPEALKGSVADGSTKPENIEVAGYSDWYSFCVNEWGTKWDVGGDYIEFEDNGLVVHMTFDSAWSPPMGLYEKLYELGFNVKAYYYEPGMGFCGIYDNGVDEEYNTDEDIPEDLDEMFGISEDRVSWEDEA